MGVGIFFAHRGLFVCHLLFSHPLFLFVENQFNYWFFFVPIVFFNICCIFIENNIIMDKPKQIFMDANIHFELKKIAKERFMTVGKLNSLIVTEWLKQQNTNQ
jgi:hypothetical protein